ncbi:MAG: MBL fold metallo-hydrolase [Verrucomicrobiota bacterium]
MTQNIPLEDTVADVVSKAMRGLGISDACLAEKCALITPDIVSLRTGHWNESVAKAVAPFLKLDPEALVSLAESRSAPPNISVSNLESYPTPFGDMIVNSYLAWDPVSKQAVAFDTGADCSDLLAFLDKTKVQLKSLFLTHTHGDHVFEMDRIREKTGASIFVNEREPIEGATPFAAGHSWQVGALGIESRLTWGHSKGGTTYVLTGLQVPVAIVGDALFACSMGGGMVSYPDALHTNREQIFTLPPATVLCPGHGPLTTVEWELTHNPFFGPATR